MVAAVSGGTELPSGLEFVRTTPVFDETTMPAGFRRAHRIADGVWGRLVAHSGTVTLVFEDDPERPLRVSTGEHLVIQPATPHHVELSEGASFAVEFYRRPTARP